MDGLAGHWRWGHLLGLVAVALLLLVLWRIPALSWVAYPFRLFGTFVHELSHGLAAWATGGSFLRLVVNADLSGTAWSAGGTRWVVASAGYVGSAVFGALLLLAARHLPSRALLAAIGVGLVLLCATHVRNAFGILAGLLLASALLLAARYLRALKAEALLLVLALQCLLDGFASLFDLLRLSLRGDVHTDAHTLAQLSGLPAPLWAVLWGLVSATLAILVLRLATRPARPTLATATPP